MTQSRTLSRYLLDHNRGRYRVGLTVSRESRSGTERARTARGAQRLLALIAAIGLLLGMVPSPPAAAADRDVDASKLELALLRAISDRPRGKFPVIVQRERYASGHSERVRAGAVAIGRELGLDQAQLGTLELAAL